jgi:hypothetical protein
MEQVLSGINTSMIRQLEVVKIKGCSYWRKNSEKTVNFGAACM